MDKYKRYRQKMLDQGRCPHCGIICEPYTECAARRESKRLSRNKGAYNRRTEDARRVPRIAGKPIIYMDDFIEMMMDDGTPVKPSMFDYPKGARP